MAEDKQTAIGAEGTTQQTEGTQTTVPVVETPVIENKDPLSSAGSVSSEITKTAEAATQEADLQYPDYGEDTANSIVNTLKTAKVPAAKAKEIFAEAVQSLDPSKIDKKALEALVGKDAAELTVLRLEKLLGARAVSIKDSVQAIHGVFGSKETSDKVFAWANAKAKADPAFQAEYSEYIQMLDKSKTQAVIASETLKRKYESDPNNSSLGVKMVQGDKAAAVIADDAKLTRAQYLDAVKQAHKSGDEKEVTRLRKLRLQTMQEQD